MTAFDSGSFSDIANTPMGKQLWELLNTEDSRIRMETATYLGKPALEGLQRQFIAVHRRQPSLDNRHAASCSILDQSNVDLSNKVRSERMQTM